MRSNIRIRGTWMTRNVEGLPAHPLMHVSVETRPRGAGMFVKVAPWSEIVQQKQLFPKTKHNSAEACALNTKVRGLMRCKNDSFFKVTVLNQLTDNRKTSPTYFCFHMNGHFKTAQTRQRRRVKLTLALFHNNSSPRTSELKSNLFGQRKQTNVAYSRDKWSERKELP